MELGEGGFKECGRGHGYQHPFACPTDTIDLIHLHIGPPFLIDVLVRCPLPFLQTISLSRFFFFSFTPNRTECVRITK